MLSKDEISFEVTYKKWSKSIDRAFQKKLHDLFSKSVGPSFVGGPDHDFPDPEHCGEAQLAAQNAAADLSRKNKKSRQKAAKGPL